MCCWSPAVSSRWSPAHPVITSARTRCIAVYSCLPRTRVSLFTRVKHTTVSGQLFVSLSLCRILYFLHLQGEEFFLNIIILISFLRPSFLQLVHNLKKKNYIIFSIYSERLNIIFWKFLRTNLSALANHCKKKKKIIILFYKKIFKKFSSCWSSIGILFLFLIIFAWSLQVLQYFLKLPYILTCWIFLNWPSVTDCIWEKGEKMCLCLVEK